ncbi:MULTISPECIES: flagellar motor switch protein FliN [Cupriavidus]|uniref:Flagellar motor switch protein FliN n=1 Tax=Cupriavidus pauculus TaxID=82633 RepID=A0A3G8H854_9BURK|nr:MULTISPECIES: flagellar motor switch protein FliN [Cupriavidus]AZG16355.1 flagellar motor switch protein FliN [Cupriavidus pauculus]MDT6963395.1 flagellar motor switch protein FliN [Cupriavidus sp. SZY C1]
MTDGTQDKPVDPMDDWASALAEQTSAEQAAPAADATATAAPVAPASAMATATPAASTVFPPLAQDAPSGFHNDIGMILDIPVQLTVELGRTKVPIKNLLQLAQGSVVELDGLAGEPMDVLVNGYLIAQGEVVVVNDKFGIRLTDIITPSERIRKLNK